MKCQTIRKITRSLKPALRVMSNHRCTQGQRLILAYHGISKNPQFNCVTRDAFREHLIWMRNRYRVVPLSELVNDLGTSPAPDRVNMSSITFDDGYTNFPELALPVLQELGFHATVFVPSGKIGYYNDWDRMHAEFCRMDIMSLSELRQLPQESVEIGSHGITHTPLNRVSDTEIKREIIGSRSEVEQRTGRRVRFFSFPFGAYPIRRRLKLYDSEFRPIGGYLAACSSRWGRFNTKRDIPMLRRIGVWDSDSFGDFVDKIQGRYDWLALKERAGRYYKTVMCYFTEAPRRV